MKTDIRISGMPAIEGILTELPKRIQKRVLRAAISASASPVNKAAKSYAPTETRGLKKAIGTKVVTYKNGGVVAIIGVRRGEQYSTVDRRGRRRVPGFYQHLVHGGTKPHIIAASTSAKALAFPNKQGKTIIAPYVNHPGTKANPFLARAWNAMQGRAIATLIGTARKRSEIELQKLASKRK